jgi:hypothetical protein
MGPLGGAKLVASAVSKGAKATKVPNPNGSIVHVTLGNNFVYYDKVQRYLEKATSQEDAIARLRYMGKTPKDGTFFDAIP